MRILENIIFVPECGKTIRNTSFQNCKIKEQNYYRAVIENCIFINCDLSESNFSKTKIMNCKFVKCYMQFAAMVRVNIFNCEFIDCDLWHSNLCHSTVRKTIFEKCIIRALFKELNWEGNIYDKYTIIESCGGTVCGLNEDILNSFIRKSQYSNRREVAE